MAAAFLGMFLLGGCESEELEQRSFPLAVGVDVQGKPSMEDGKEAEPKLVVSFDFPDLGYPDVHVFGGRRFVPCGEII